MSKKNFIKNRGRVFVQTAQTVSAYWANACRYDGSALDAIHLNTPRRITDSDGNTVWSWDGAPFGNTPPTAETTGAGQFTFNLRFPGQYYDAETGLNQNYYRDYDTGSERYIESDQLDWTGESVLIVMSGRDQPILLIHLD